MLLKSLNYWQQKWDALSKPRLAYNYLITLGVCEHFFNYRHVVRTQLLAQLAALKQAKLTQGKQEVVTLAYEAATII